MQQSVVPQDLPNNAPEISLEELYDAGVHIGHEVSKWHPKMSEWIFGERNDVHIFDLEKTAAQMKTAYNYAYHLGKTKKNLVVVGTKRQVREALQQVCQDTKTMYITSRWLGGMLTNWEQVVKSLKRMLRLESGLADGSFKNYTKYEQVQLDKERAKLSRFFNGVRDLKSEPDVLLVIDPKREDNAVKEARSTNVPVIAITDSDSDPRELDLVVPANTGAVESVSRVARYIIEGYAAGKAAA